MRFDLRKMILASLFAILTAIGARISFQIGPVPLTLQTLFTLLGGTLLGSTAGAASQLLYIFMGLAGLPVFAKGGGIGYVLEPSFGYMIGFAAAAFLIGLICEKTGRFAAILGACLAGIAVIYVIGIAYLYLILNLSLGTPVTVAKAFAIGTGSLIWKDIALCFVAALISVRLAPVIRRVAVKR